MSEDKDCGCDVSFGENTAVDDTKCKYPAALETIAWMEARIKALESDVSRLSGATRPLSVEERTRLYEAASKIKFPFE